MEGGRARRGHRRGAAPAGQGRDRHYLVPVGNGHGRPEEIFGGRPEHGKRLLLAHQLSAQGNRTAGLRHVVDDHRLHLPTADAAGRVGCVDRDLRTFERGTSVPSQIAGRLEVQPDFDGLAEMGLRTGRTIAAHQQRQDCQPREGHHEASPQ